uniref:Uncharacterized protein n=1 Tax=Timema tahoe TaxID=61484 RepID=A0A7R9P080_9NEOP|nr:unnamed protein product [Timema tahoe]
MHSEDNCNLKRAMAVCLTLMAGRTGVVGGSLMIGALIETHCSLAFVVLSGVSLLSSLAIQSYLTKELNLDYLVCSKLRTKFNSYSSFHISVKEDDFPVINNSDTWPSGCLIAPYYGKLLPEQIICEESPCVSAPVNAAVASDLGSQEDSTQTPRVTIDGGLEATSQHISQ